MQLLSPPCRQPAGSRRLFPTCGLLPIACGLLLLIAHALHAQSVAPPPSPAPMAPPPEQQGSALEPAPPCIGCYRGFVYDSVFRIGAHFNGSWPGAPQFLKDTLHIGITQMYGQPYLYQFFYPTDTSDARVNWVHGLQRQFWRDVKAADLKVILQPGNVSAIAKGSKMSEAFFGQSTSDTIHRIDFATLGSNDGGIDRPERSFFWGGMFLQSPSLTTPQLMAGEPHWTAMGIAQLGYYLSSQSADTGKYDIAIALKIDTGATSFRSLSPDSLIAYVKVYRRIPVGQSICACNLFEYVDSLPVTKAVYLDTATSDPRAGNLYRDVTFSFRISEPAITAAAPLKIVLGTGDTVQAFTAGTYPKYVPRGGFLGWGMQRAPITGTQRIRLPGSTATAAAFATPSLRAATTILRRCLMLPPSSTMGTTATRSVPRARWMSR
ncbi:MAG TPA: hypothetical protein VHI13_04550 [Candidatus Kapabacteria bacterium]|nr:hypothetical protein [Candidatus Kapabacteria bacterium]